MEEFGKGRLPNDAGTFAKSASSNKIISIYGLTLSPVSFHDNGRPALAEVVGCDELSPYKNLKGNYVYLNQDGLPDVRFGYVSPTKFNEYGFLTANLSGTFNNREKALLSKSTGAMCKAATDDKEFDALVEMALLCFKNPINLKYFLPTLAICDQSALNFMMTIAADGIEKQTKDRIKELEKDLNNSDRSFFVEYFNVKGSWVKVNDFINSLNIKLEEIKATTPQNLFVYAERLPISLKTELQAGYFNKLSSNYYGIKDQFFMVKKEFEDFKKKKETSGFDSVKFAELYEKVKGADGIIAKTNLLLGDIKYLKLKAQENIDNLPKIKQELDYIISEIEPFIGGGFGWYSAALNETTIIDDAGTIKPGISDEIKRKIRETSIEVIDDLADWSSIHEVKEKYLTSRAFNVKDNASVYQRWCEKLLEEEKEFAYKLDILNAYDRSGKVVQDLRNGSMVQNFIYGKGQRGEE